nr:hypothetical protein [Tanacetum cinerariifolium]
RKRRDLPRTPSGSPPPHPPPPPPPLGVSGNEALSLSKSAASAPQSIAWTTSDTRYESAGISGTQELSPTDSLIQHDSIPDDKGSSFALLISKMKAASYPDFGLELLVPEQMWIDDVCTYDIKVRSNMRILSIVRIKAYSRYGYDYLSEIVLRRADIQEYTIAEKDFKKLYPSHFEDLNLLLLQDFQLGIESYQAQLNLTKPGWDATGYEFKHDYTIIDSPQAVVFLVNNNERKIMRFNEIYKFSDGTLTRILEALAYRVKEFKIKQLNPGMNTRFWTQNDVTRSKEFIVAIERRLKTRRIYRNLEFVGGRVRDIDYRLLQRTE